MISRQTLLAEDFVKRIERGARVRGFVKMHAWTKKRGILWEFEKENLILTGALPIIAALVGGTGTIAADSISAVGFGSGSSTPVIGNTDITAPAYYKALPSPTNPNPGYAQWAWTLAAGGADAAAVGINVQELGFYANTGAVSLPVNRPSGAAPNMTLCARILYPLGVISGINYTATWTFEA